MRLRCFERDTIVGTFQSLFPVGDTLWLFGSRVNDSHRGGDIDLFIESTLDHESLFSLKIQFLNDLKKKMGDQKIDIVVRSLQDEQILPIYEEARKTGVKLVMNDLERLKVDIAICDVHTQRIEQSLEHLKHLLPIKPIQLQDLSIEEISFLELLNSRFSKLQDSIGNKVFIQLLKLLQEYEDNNSFIDNLNKLEKLNIIESAVFWQKMRDIRNHISHEYPGLPVEQANQMNACFKAAQELIVFWQGLKGYIGKKFFL